MPANTKPPCHLKLALMSIFYLQVPSGKRECQCHGHKHSKSIGTHAKHQKTVKHKHPLFLMNRTIALVQRQYPYFCTSDIL